VQRASGVPHASKGRKIHQRLGRVARRGRKRLFAIQAHHAPNRHRPRRSLKDTDLILRSLRSKRLEGWTQRRDSRPSFETPQARLLRMRSEIYSSPAKAAIQYSEASVMESKGARLDTRRACHRRPFGRPVGGYDDSNAEVLVGNRGAGLLTRLRILDVEFAHCAGNDEIM